MVVGRVRVGLSIVGARLSLAPNILNPTLTLPTTIKTHVKGKFSRVKKIWDDSCWNSFYTIDALCRDSGAFYRSSSFRVSRELRGPNPGGFCASPRANLAATLRARDVPRTSSRCRFYRRPGLVPAPAYAGS